jgi:spermidine/putrescine transport system ATP-binding protein
MLEVRSIWKQYEGQPLLCGVSFQVGPGETVCLLGASGSGKSTLLRIITGLEPMEAGQVLWNGRDLSGVPVHQRNFGLMFQEYALFPHKNVYENVAFGLRMQRLPRAEIDQRVQESLDLVNMAAFARRRVTDLSGGEQQRVALARALAPRPHLLMLDEPLGALDRALKANVEEEIRRLLHASGIPAIYVTHDQEEAFAIADRLVLLNHGEVVQNGIPSEVYDHPATAWVAGFLGLNNLLPGKVTGLSPLTAQTGLGTFQGRGTLNHNFQEGEQVTVLLRPGGASSGSGGEGLNQFRARVEENIYQGNDFRVVVKTGMGQEISFVMDQALPAGQEVFVRVEPASVQLLKEHPDE